MSSSADRILIRHVPEIVFGTTPVDSALWKELPITGESLTAAPNYIESEVMNPARTLQDMVLSGKGASGGIEGELRAADWDDFLEDVFQGTWTANVLKVGTTQRSRSIEKEFQDLTTYWNIATGMQINTFDINVAYGALATISFGFEGFDTATAVVSAVGLGSSTAASANGSIDGSAGTVVNIDGAPVTGAVFRSFAMNITNNLRPVEGMGTVGRDSISNGSNSVSGTLEMYLSDDTKSFYADMLAGTDRAINIIMTRGAASFDFKIPAAKFTGGDPQATGRNSDIMLSLGFTGQHDATDATSVMVTRVP